MISSVASVPSPAQTATVAPSANSARPPYLQRGDEVDKKYQAYRQRLEHFFSAFDKRLEVEAPDLRPKLLPPAPVSYGYQILPHLLPEASWKPQARRVRLSPFSWSRTEQLIDRDSARLVALSLRLRDSVHTDTNQRHSDHESIVADYKKLVDGQKLMAAQIGYNRLWQADVARIPKQYEDARALQDAAFERQRLSDSAGLAGSLDKARLSRIDTLTTKINDAIRKLATPQFVQLVQPEAHRWMLKVPVYTDIEDSTFVEQFRSAIETGWHVRDGRDEFGVILEIRRLTPSQLYPKGDAPAKGTHIDLVAHIDRFRQDGAVLTTGATSIQARGRAIIPGPHAVGVGALVHEFGHVLGFQDGYFRSYQDRGMDGYEIIEVILDPETVVGAPEYGHVRREHFDQVIRELNGR
ncbi:MAG: hypothetical protein ABIU86_07720 [Gemmatimonadaceae bacterium]